MSFINYIPCRVLFFPLMVSYILLTCTCVMTSSGPKETVVSVNPKSSPCGGFKDQAILNKCRLIPEDTLPCLEETLFWRYDSTSRILSLAHRCIRDNCAAVLTMYVVKEESGRLLICQSDKRDPNLSAGCVCEFDLYCDVPEITGQTITLSLDTFTIPLNFGDQRGKIILHPLEYLDMHGTPDSDLSFLAAYPQLKSLSYVDAAYYTDLTPIGNLSNLTYLSCINVDSIGFLETCTKLQYLDLRATSRLDDLSALQNLNDLQSLYLSGASSIQDISSIGNCRRIQSLSLTGCIGITDITPISACTDLTVLTLSNCPAISTLQPLTDLRELANLVLDSLTDVISLEPLGSLRKLVSLSISNNGVITDISPLSELTSIKDLHLMNLKAITDFSPLISLLGEGDVFSYIGMSIPADVLSQLEKNGVVYKGRERE